MTKKRIFGLNLFFLVLLFSPSASSALSIAPNSVATIKFEIPTGPVYDHPRFYVYSTDNIDWDWFSVSIYDNLNSTAIKYYFDLKYYPPEFYADIMVPNNSFDEDGISYIIFESSGVKPHLGPNEAPFEISTFNVQFDETYSVVNGRSIAHGTLVASPSPVPEPATILLLGCGLIGLAGYGRKKLS